MNAFLEHFGWMLVHSVWMAVAAWLLLRIALVALRRSSARIRYAAGCVTLAVATLAPAAMLVRLELGGRTATAERIAAVSAWIETERAPAPNSVIAAASVRTPFGETLSETHWQAGAESWFEPVLPWLALGWAVGAAWSGTRLLLGWRRIGRLHRQPCAPLTAAWAERAEAMLRLLGVRRAVRFGVSALVEVPTVLGWLKPVVLFPPSALAGLTPAQFEAVVAHELAHVVRGDFLVNLLQAIAETVYFFNPAIYALNRLVRAEREQACDDLAVAVTGDARGFAEALALLEASRTPEPALAATGGELLARVRRLLGRPAAPVPVWRCAAWVFGAGLVLYLGGMLATPALAAWLMTTQERMQAVAKELPESPARRLAGFGLDETMRVVGELRVPDGSMFPGDVELNAVSARDNHYFGLSLQVRAGRIEQDVPAGELSIDGWVEGWAPFSVGSLLPDVARKTVGPVRINLVKGAPLRVRFVDETGAALPGVRVTGILHRANETRYSYVWFKERTETGDAAGEVTFQDLGPGFELQFDAERSGYQTERRSIGLSGDGATVRWPLRRAQPFTGSVVDAESGQPIAGARISLHQWIDPDQDQRSMLNQDPEKQMLARTDATGRFHLETLNARRKYELFVEADGYALISQAIIANAAPTIRLTRGTSLFGTVVHAPPGNLRIACAFSLDRAGDGDALRAVRREIVVEGDGPTREFRFENLPRCVGRVSLSRADGSPLSVRFDLRTNQPDLALDVLAPPKSPQSPVPASAAREVVIAFHSGIGQPAPGGLLSALYDHEAPPNHSVSRMEQLIPVDGPELRLRPIAPSKLELSASRLIGFWFPSRTVDVSAGTEPLRVDVDLEPAGAIRGRLRESDGRGGVPASFYCTVLDTPAGESTSLAAAGDPEHQRNPDGTFTITPVPFGRRYQVVAWYDRFNFTVSPPVRVSARHPLPVLELVRQPGTTITGRVVDEAGAPVVFHKMRLQYETPSGSGFGCEFVTDAVGSFALPGVNLDAPGHYEISPQWDVDEVRPARDGSGRMERNQLEGSMPLSRDTPLPLQVVVRRSKAATVADDGS